MRYSLPAVLTLVAACADVDPSFDGSFDAPEVDAATAERTYARLSLAGRRQVYPNEAVTYVVTGARPNTQVQLWGSRFSTGRGIVFPGQGLNLDVSGPTVFRLVGTSNANGVVSFDVTWTAPVGAAFEIQAMTPVGGDWYVTPAPRIDIVAPVCGDGRLAPSEACDDGNAIAGDGCSPSCAVETCPDGDADGVCDADDRCLVGDDGLDGDGDGIPDACDVACPCFDDALLEASWTSVPGVSFVGPGVFDGTEYSVEGWGTGADPMYWRARTGTFDGPPPFNDWCDYAAPAPLSGGSALTQWLTPEVQAACARALSTWGSAHGATW